MRTLPTTSRGRLLTSVAATAGYTALITLIIMLLTTSGLVAAIAGALTVSLLIGSYLLERWARRRTVYTGDSPPSPTAPHATDAYTDDVVGVPRPSDFEEARMAKI